MYISPIGSFWFCFSGCHVTNWVGDFYYDKKEEKDRYWGTIMKKKYL